MKTEREEGAAEGGDTQDHTFSKLTLKHSALIKAQVPLFTGGISLSLSLSIIACRQTAQTPELCQMMEHHNYALFIGRLIPAMTDAAPKP